MSKPIYKMTHGAIGEAMCCYTEGSYKDADIALTGYENTIRADERAKTIKEMTEIITELNDDTTICNSFNCPRADEPITCTMCILERAIKQMKKE